MSSPIDIGDFDLGNLYEVLSEELDLKSEWFDEELIETGLEFTESKETLSQQENAGTKLFTLNATLNLCHCQTTFVNTIVTLNKTEKCQNI